MKICPKDCPKRGKRICHTMECPTWKKAVEEFKEKVKKAHEHA